jgi:hypothetical protein
MSGGFAEPDGKGNANDKRPRGSSAQSDDQAGSARVQTLPAFTHAECNDQGLWGKPTEPEPPRWLDLELVASITAASGQQFVLQPIQEFGAGFFDLHLRTIRHLPT